MATFGKVWLLLATYGNFWQFLARYGYFWQLMATFGSLCLLPAHYGNFWQHFGDACKLESFCAEYSFLQHLYLSWIYAASNLGNECQLNIYVWVHSQSNMTMFCLKEKLISQPWGSKSRHFWMTLAHYILISVIFIGPR